MTYDTTPLLRWFFLAWLSIVYLWGVFLELGKTTSKCTKLLAGKCLEASQQADVNIYIIIAFTLLILLSGSLIWLVLSKHYKTLHSYLACILQTFLVAGIGFLFPGEGATMILNLFLSLIILVSIVFKHVLYSAIIILLCIFLWSMTLVNEISPKQQSITWVGIIQLIPLYAAPLVFGVGYLILYRQLTRYYERLEVAHQELATSIERIETLTVLAERQRMARELHDTLAQGLTGVMLLVQGAYLHLTQQRYALATQVMQQTMKSARDTLTSARAAIDDLRKTKTISTQFSEAIQEDIKNFSIATNIPCTTTALDLLALLPVPIFEHVQHIINEALSNIARHAHARHVWIGIILHQSQLTIEVQDDGVGFDIAAVAQFTGHYGLLGLRERARIIASDIDIISECAKGTLIRLNILLEKNNLEEINEK